MLWKFPLLALALVLVSGCAQRPPPRLYLLPPPNDAEAAAAQRDRPVVGTVRVTLPRYLDRDELVQRSGTHGLAIAEDDRWAEPLADGVQRAMAAKLSQRLAQGRIEATPGSQGARPKVEIRIDLDAFEAADDGTAAIAGRWVAQSAEGGRTLASGTIARREPIAGSDYGAVVAALDRNLDAVSAEVAAGTTTALARAEARAKPR